MSAQLWALAVTGAIVFVAACLETYRSRRARRLVLSAGPSRLSGHLRMNGEENAPFIIYFTGDSCTVCRTHQEPALARLGDVRVDKVDAVAERTLADRFHVYTLPTTVVMAADGSPLHVNYGYAPAPKLQRQLAEARGAALGAAATA
ncbi:MAG TPA: thioredoxin family protein [Candidatus Dormibacteraeota bacterium]